VVFFSLRIEVLKCCSPALNYVCCRPLLSFLRLSRRERGLLKRTSLPFPSSKSPSNLQHKFCFLFGESPPQWLHDTAGICPDPFLPKNTFPLYSFSLLEKIFAMSPLSVLADAFFSVRTLTRVLLLQSANSELVDPEFRPLTDAVFFFPSSPFFPQARMDLSPQSRNDLLQFFLAGEKLSRSPPPFGFLRPFPGSLFASSTPVTVLPFFTSAPDSTTFGGMPSFG